LSVDITGTGAETAGDEEETLFLAREPRSRSGSRVRCVDRDITPDRSPPMPTFNQAHMFIDHTSPSDHLRSSLPPTLVPQLSPSFNTSALPSARKRKRLNELDLLELPNFTPFNSTRRPK